MADFEDRFLDRRLAEGVETPDGFRAALARHLGLPPESLPAKGLLRAAPIATPLGPMVAVCDARSLHLLEFADRRALPAELKKLHAACRGSLGIGRFDLHDRVERQLGEYFSGRRAVFDLPLTFHGSAFAKEVWRALLAIRAGETLSYGAIARGLGQPLGVRAVARANGANQIAIVIPCHRVIGADGALTGYGGGLWRKRRLLDLEQSYRA